MSWERYSYWLIIGGVVFLLFADRRARPPGTASAGDVPASRTVIPYDELLSKIEIIGKLGVPIGEDVQVIGEVIGPRTKRDLGHAILKVISINGHTVKTDHPILVLKAGIRGWDTASIDTKHLINDDPDDPFDYPDFRPVPGTILECIGYEVGRFDGKVGRTKKGDLVRNGMDFRLYFATAAAWTPSGTADR